jgi:hypothetical protein
MTIFSPIIIHLNQSLFSIQSILFSYGSFFLPKMLCDDSDDDLEIIIGGMKEGSTLHHCGIHRRRSIRRDWL